MNFDVFLIFLHVNRRQQNGYFVSSDNIKYIHLLETKSTESTKFVDAVHVDITGFKGCRVQINRLLL